MLKIQSKPLSYLSAVIACSIMALTAGCASGGFKLTRQYAGWVNSQHVILRVILYILTSVVFVVTLIIDAVVFNTMDFWDGKVSAGTYDFKGGDKTYHVRHEFLPGSKLKRSTIQVMDLNRAPLQEIVLNETPSGEIEMFIDGKLKTRIHGFSKTPIASMFDKNGKLTEENVLWPTPALAMNRASISAN